MDELDLIAAYVRQLEEALTRAGRPAQPLAGEAAAHLCEDAARIARVEGCGESEAARRAIARFGDVSAVVAASRKHGRTLAASVARIMSIVVLAVVARGMFSTFVEGDYWPPEPGLPREMAPGMLLGVELIVVSILLLRALAGRAVSRALPIALQLNAAVALVLFVGCAVEDLNLHLHQVRFYQPIAEWVLVQREQPLWELIFVHAAVGLRALGGLRNRNGELAHA